MDNGLGHCPFFVFRLYLASKTIQNPEPPRTIQNSEPSRIQNPEPSRTQNHPASKTIQHPESRTQNHPPLLPLCPFQNAFTVLKAPVVEGNDYRIQRITVVSQFIFDGNGRGRIHLSYHKFVLFEVFQLLA